jgi:hypothetical protein
VITLLALSAYLTFWMHESDPLALQACAEVYPGPVGWLCQKSLFWFHPTAEEVARLNREAGAAYAARAKDKALGRRLLKHYIQAGVDVNARDQRTKVGWTALHAMAVEGDVEGVRMLLESGADARIVDQQGMTALDWAWRMNETGSSVELAEVVRVLEETATPGK